MKITLDEGAVMPSWAHDFDAGMDLHAKADSQPVMIPPLADSGYSTPEYTQRFRSIFCGLIKSRSGLLLKGIKTDGLIDADYTGSIRVILFNHGEYSYTVQPGDKIAQMVIAPCLRPPLEVVDCLEKTKRGNNGFGSTGR